MVTPKPFNEAEWHEGVQRREIYRRALTLCQLAEKVRYGEDYTTTTPEILANLVAQIASTISEKVLTDIPSGDLEQVNAFLGFITPHLRYVERARVTATPWSIVQAAEELFRKAAGPGSNFIIRPNWAYNYALIGDFWKAYSNIIANWTWFPLDELKKKTRLDDEKSIFCISFPRIERNNCLLHANWGHEIGHIFAAKWDSTEFSNAWSAAEPAIRSNIELSLSSAPSSPIVKSFVLAKRMKKTMQVARRGFIELLCDIIGAHLYGPSTLAASLEFSALFKLDVPPLATSDFYPPWRYRIRKIVEFCEPDLIDNPDDKYPNEELRPFVEWLQTGKNLASEKSDIVNIDLDPISREAYKFIEQNWAQASKSILSMLPPALAKAYRLSERHKEIGKLIQRLDNSIPPNEVNILSNEPSSLQDILCSAWAYKIRSISENPKWGSQKEFNLLFRLVLKACESSYFHADWLNKEKGLFRLCCAAKQR